MKTINWIAMLGLAMPIILVFLPDFPAEAATAAITNGVILIAYIIHKIKDSGEV